MSEVEREEVLAVLRSTAYCDLAVAQVWARELDEGRYWCSISSMYRILRANGEVRERRSQATHPARVKPELVASGPNEVWSWDIERHEALLNRVGVGFLHRLVVAAAG
jgi:putative transposase